MKKIFRLFLLLLGIVSFTATSRALASEISIKNAGFIPSNIWYSKESFFAGETVRIYTIVFNGSSYNLSGDVEFLDNGVVLGRTPFSLLTSTLTRDVSIPWKATEGSHAITARIRNANMSLPDGQKTSIVLENTETGKSDIVVEADPATKAAREKTAIGTQITGKIQDTLQNVSDVIPEQVKSGTAASANIVENFRTTEGFQARLAKELKGKQIDALNARTGTTTTTKTGFLNTVSRTTEKPFAYVMYAILALLQYFFEWRILFYGAILYAMYRLLKWGIAKIRNR